MAIGIECPKCGNHTWRVTGWTNPFIIQRLKCDVCWYEEFYVEPKERKVCSGCDVPKNPSIGNDHPIRLRKRCPKCKSKLRPYWNSEKDILELKCDKCYWNEEQI